MSGDQVWSRFSHGDGLYTVKQGREAYCFCCAFVNDGDGIYVSSNIDEFLIHVAKHRYAKHAVPDRLERLIRESW